MLNKIGKSWQFYALILATSLFFTNSALAEEKTTEIREIEEITNVDETDGMAQVTSVSQLSDVQPTDWAFGALQSLVERYGCIAGYPDSTYRGNRAMTRYEFAAGLNACLDRVNELIRTATADFIPKADLATLQRLQTEFEPELANLRQQIDTLEARTANLLASPSFSTTAQLNGEALMAVSGVEGNNTDSNIILTQRATLNFDTSFYGRDRFRVGIEAKNTPSFAPFTGTEMSKLSFTGDSNNNVEVVNVSYEFNVSPQVLVYVSAVGGGLDSFTNTLNAPINSSTLGTVSNFGGQNPIYGLNGGGTGAGVQYIFNRAVRLSVGYMSGGANDPNVGFGRGANGAIAQLTLQPTNELGIGLTYIRSYNAINTGKGSTSANDPFAGGSNTSNAYGIQAQYRISDGYTLSGWVGFIDAEAVGGVNKGSNASIFTWAATLALPDFGREGNLLGFVFGQPPKITSNDVATREDTATSLHLEAFYRFRISDRLFITPGFFMVTNPDHNDNNDTIYIGTLRTSFLF